tara:strand:- start:10080 stop:11033 length:954 start_codon:yes stop_codon:yes gene_type:complete
MPRNVYFSQAVRSEQNLYEDLIIESLKIFGQDIYYLPRDLVNRDSILGEDTSSQFDDAYMIEGYIEGTEGFEGQGDLYSKFGLEVRDEVNFVISRKVWDRYVGFQDEVNDVPRPREGDLIFLPLSNKFFEVMFVEHEQPFYQLSNLPVYRLQCALYEYNEEDFDTGIAQIDAIEETDTYQVTIDYSTSNNNHLQKNEKVTQDLTFNNESPPVALTSVFGEIQKIEKLSASAGRIQISQIGVSGIDEARDFIVSSTLTLTGEESLQTVAITKVYDIGDNSALVDPTSSNSENVAFEVTADGFLDFTESNPFGDPSDNY